VLAPPAHDGFDAWVALLADQARAQRAYWHLMSSGQAALPAIRVGLTSPMADGRRLCTKTLDQLIDEDSFPTLITMLDDGNPQVRVEALHALACDRCKDNTCRPDPEIRSAESRATARLDSCAAGDVGHSGRAGWGEWSG